MEADWNETFRIAFPGPSPTAPSTTVTAFAFDNEQELIWTGNEFGRVTSFYGAELQKYTSYRGHVNTAPRGAPGNAPVKQFLFCAKGVLSVSARSVHLASRGGLTQWHLTQPGMTDLRCMSFTGKGTDEIVVGGCQRDAYRIDVDRGTIVETITSAAPVPFTLMRRAKDVICAASHDGSIFLLDPKTLSVLHSWKAYAGNVSDMDARGDYLLTCGWAQQQYQGLGLERLIRVFDLKNLRPLAPVSFPSGAAFVRMHPKLSSTCVVTSQSGVIHSIDVQNPDVPMMRYANTFDATLTGLELMSSGKGFAMIDSHCQIALWGSPNKTQFTEFSKPTEFPDPAPPIKLLKWTTDFPLSTIGMPFYREALLSGWPNSLVHHIGAPPTKIDPALLATLRPAEFGLVGLNNRKARRYQVENTRSSHQTHDPLMAPKFLSDKAREDSGEHEGERRMSEDIGKTLSGLALSGARNDDMFYYRPPEIKYSKFGVDDFDFKYFNKTKYSGLETHIVNSYANPLLQIFRFTNVARNLVLHHTAQDCRNDNCLVCELGFLVDMLEKAAGQNCQATNFLKALSKQPAASTLAILEGSTPNTPLTTMIQHLNRFLLMRLDDNYKRTAGHSADIQGVFGTKANAFSQCTHCGYEDAREQTWYSHDMIYPPKPAKHSPRSVRTYFSKILKDSVERYDQQRGWCMRCQGYKAIRSRRAIQTIPAVLMLNAALTSAEARQLWSMPGFLPREIGIIVHNGQFYCYEGQDLQLHLQRRTYDITVYELVGFVADVAAGEAQKSHMVAIVDASVSNPDATRGEDWHLVNDFLVRPLAPEEALHFDQKWKLPSVIAYQAKSRSHFVDDSWKANIDTSVLYRSVTQPAFHPYYQLKALTQSELLPGPDTHCAIDAEFVRLLREEIDIGVDGSRKITRPARSGLARVSVLRGDGPQEELPFIDDYIAIEEPVDDYLTQYSGLHPGDLTAGISRFTLVNLKEVYKKLWILLNLGCKFIGHGLSSDFRTINIHVPEAQVIDTQDLFSLKRHGSQRKLSLRFLAYFLLQEDIQQNVSEGHDSIEDARAALKLWRKHLEYEAKGITDQINDEIWYKGKATDFRVPSAMTSAAAQDGGKRLPETPQGSVPGTPTRQPASVVRMSTPSGQHVRTPSAANGGGHARSEFGSPLKEADK